MITKGCLTMAFTTAFSEFDPTKVTSNPSDGWGQAAIRIGENEPGRQSQIVLTMAEAWKLAECLIAECEKLDLKFKRENEALNAAYAAAVAAE